MIQGLFSPIPPEQEAARLHSLYSYAVLDSSPEVCFDELSELASEICGCPAAYISLVGETRQWMKSICRLPPVMCDISRDHAICSRTICQHDIIEIEDLALDATFKDLPIVVGDPHLRYYCGAPLVNAQGHVLGSLCVVDFEPRKLDHEKREALRMLSHQVVAQLEMRRTLAALRSTQKELEARRNDAQSLMRHVMPEEIARELQENGTVEPRYFSSATILFTDFVKFSSKSEPMGPHEIIEMLDGFFSAYDAIMPQHRMERLKTIGDSYMAAAGLPTENRTHAADACLAALEMRTFMARHNRERTRMRQPAWEMRIGINTGSVLAGMVGTDKFAYDVWGHAVNLASRMESAGEANRVNVSQNTYEAVKHLFVFEEREPHEVKNLGRVPMYFVERILPELSANEESTLANDLFWQKRA